MNYEDECIDSHTGNCSGSLVTDVSQYGTERTRCEHHYLINEQKLDTIASQYELGIRD